MIPVAGSAYTFAYATLGELIAWMIGWDLILEYAVSNMAVAVASPLTSTIFSTACSVFTCPWHGAGRPLSPGDYTGAIFNLPAFVVLMVLTVLLVRGVRESSRTNNVMVLIKVAAILIFVFGAARAIDPANYHPFLPNGFQGLLTDRRSSFLPTSASTRFQRPPRSAAILSETFRSALSARWLPALCSTFR